VVRVPIDIRIMERDVREMTLAELRREATTLRAWIRDVKTPKSVRLREISAEVETRKARKGDIALARKSAGTD